MTSNTKLIEFFTRVPQCSADGTNWTYYRDRFIFAAEAAQLNDYLEETAAPPSAPTPADPNNPTKEESDSLARYPGVVRLWKANEAIVKQALASTIPDSLFLKVKGEKSAGLMWKKVKEEFQKRSKMMTVDLRRRLQDERCPENGDVKAHLTKLQALREELIAMSADPGDDNFIAILLGSLPTSYDPYLAALTATSALLNQTIDPDTYIRGIGDEADRRRIKNRTKEEKEAAFNANGGSSGHGRRGKRSSTVECYNCHKKGHIKAECWAKGGGKEGQGPRGKGKSAAANKAADYDDGVWYAHADSSDGDSELDDWRDLAEMNLGGYDEPWFEYAHEGGTEKLEGLAGT